MTTSREASGTGPEEAAPGPDEAGTDADPERSSARELLRRALRWLRDLHTGFAHTGHLPRRRD